MKKFIPSPFEALSNTFLNSASRFTACVIWSSGLSFLQPVSTLTATADKRTNRAIEFIINCIFRKRLLISYPQKYGIFDKRLLFSYPQKYGIFDKRLLFPVKHLLKIHERFRKIGLVLLHEASVQPRQYSKDGCAGSSD